MDFPIPSLIDETQAAAWVLGHFHPEGLCCPKCQASVSEARLFCKTKQVVYKSIAANGVKASKSL